MANDPLPDFPHDDVRRIAARLKADEVLVPGFEPDPRGLLDLQALADAGEGQGIDTVLLLDRNLVSRMASVASRGLKAPLPEMDRIAIDLMAFAQSVNLQIEPSVAYHELAAPSANDAAHLELGWFNVANRGAASVWIDLALGRRTDAPLGQPEPTPVVDLSLPLRRWRYNYVVALRVAALERSAASPLDRALGLFDWMYSDFQLAGPAALYASMYFGPRAARHGMFRNLNSDDREKAIKGVKVAAWDMTHLSDFSRRITSAPKWNRYIFASGDRALLSVARLLSVPEDGAEARRALAEGFAQWWPAGDARALAERLLDLTDKVKRNDQTKWSTAADDPTPQFTAEGEAMVRATPAPQTVS